MSISPDHMSPDTYPEPQAFGMAAWALETLRAHGLDRERAKGFRALVAIRSQNIGQGRIWEIDPYATLLNAAVTERMAVVVFTDGSLLVWGGAEYGWGG